VDHVRRSRHLDALTSLLDHFPVVGLLGARQVGKTTLARDFAASRAEPVTFFDLEDPADLARLSEPDLALRELTGLVVIDEVQRRPELFPILRVLADRELSSRFLVLGSAAPRLPTWRSIASISSTPATTPFPLPSASGRWPFAASTTTSNA
jgi:predicted AAA+ superfamily ATPase